MTRRARSNAADSSAGAGELGLFLLCGLLWAAGCFLLIELRLAPSTAWSQRLILVLLSGFLGLGHGAAWMLIRHAGSRLLLARRWQRGFDALFAALVGATYAGLLLSLIKYSYSRSHLRSADLWFVFGNLRQLGGEGSGRERLLLLVALVLPLLLAALVYVGLRRAGTAPRPVALPALGQLALLAIAGLALLSWRYPYARLAAGTLVPETSAVARWLEALGSGAKDVAPYPAPFVPEPSRSARIENDSADPPARRDNVVVLMLESVPWSRLFGPLARPEATPQMNALAEESIVFARAYATATHSDYAQTSILASLHPRKFPRHDFFVDLAYPRTLIWDLLRPAGYRTALFSCQNEGWGNMQAFLRTPGLEQFRHSPDWPDAPRRGDGTESKVFEPTPVAAFAAWLNETSAAAPERFLAYLNFQATHYPYVASPDTTPLYQPSEIDFATTFLSYPREQIPLMENRFYNALHAVDAAVGEVVDALRGAGVWERTVLLIVSDHGEAFYEHGVPTHGTMLLEEQLRTAALLRLPGESARVLTEPVSVLDLVPAVAAFLGLPPHGNFQGRADILEPGYSAQGRPFLFTIQGITQEDALLADDWKLLMNRDRRELALFDLASDPQEQRNLASTQPEKLAELRGRLETLLADQLAYYRDRGWESGWYPPKLP